MFRPAAIGQSPRAELVDDAFLITCNEEGRMYLDFDDAAVDLEDGFGRAGCGDASDGETVRICARADDCARGQCVGGGAGVRGRAGGG